MQLTSEGKLNQGLSKEFKRYLPDIYSIKTSDKYTLGVSDFILWRSGRSLGLEVKLVQALPKRPDTPILKHPLLPTQSNFLIHLMKTSNLAAVIVCIRETKLLYTLDPFDFTGEGNISTRMLEMMPNYPYNQDGIKRMLDALFSGRIHG